MEDNSLSQNAVQKRSEEYDVAVKDFEQGINKLRENNNRLADLIALLDSIKIEPHIETAPEIIHQDWGFRFFNKMHSVPIIKTKKDTPPQKDGIIRALEKLSGYRISIRKET